MSPSEFVEMCEKLRVLGCVSVEAESFKATFSGPVRATVAARKDPENAETIKTFEELKAAQRAKELGR